MEGRFWHCRWERTDGGYRIRVVRRPRLVATGANWQEAMDAITSKICLETGDGEPIFIFEPPEPTDGGDGAYAHPEWTIAGAEGYLPVDAARPELFTGGYCEGCGDPLGERTDVALVGKGPGEGDLCWPALMFNRFLPVLFSERLMQALSLKERRAFRWIPVVPAPRTRKRYFEAVPRRFVAPVAVRGWTISGSVCPACGRCEFMCTSEGEIDFGSGQIHDWAAGEDLPRRRDSVVAFGNQRQWLPVFPVGRARELAKAFRGVRTAPLGVAPAGREMRAEELAEALR